MLSFILLQLVQAQIRKYDWINNYFALQCTCLEECCIYGSFILKNDKVMNTNFVQIDAKLQGSGCTQYTVENVICTLESPTDVQTTLSCPLQGWEWLVSRDSNTGSIYWTDNKNCQGVWNVIDLSANQVVYIFSPIIMLGIIIYYQL
ncbi:unnamed protein product [Paramecium pentaurelia]|uniref:Uncharacterized protein n=1 Tax=Paramecium pentaurelia TaxID=43138 RepID=A0A8S1SD49_9CILI|nr:unnamed protein product [Paramecium pentaurelia]